MDKPLWMWIVFIILVVGLLSIDLVFFNRKDHVISVKQSLWLSGFYIFVGFLFGLWIWYYLGLQSATEYLTGFLVEKSLALDNIFIISVIFSAFSIPQKYQHRVLFFGIIGVLILRGIMIGVGAGLIYKFEWVLYIFAVILIFMGIKMFFTPERKVDITKNPLLQWVKKHFRVSNELHGHDFFVYKTDPKVQKRKLFMTPLFIALLAIEFTDLVFAIDSVPAIFTITRQPYIVYTSNIFAILGLRSLYFALAAVIDRFQYLKYSLGCVLVFIGSKVFIADWLNITKIPATLSLGITFGLIAFGIIFSIYKSRKLAKMSKDNTHNKN